MARPRVDGFFSRRCFYPFVFLALLFVFARAADAQTTALFYDGQPGAKLASGQRATITSADATFQANSDGVSIQFIIRGSSFFDELDFVADPNKDASLAPGAYESARRSPFNPFNGLDVSIDSTACNELTGRFVVLEAVFAQDGSLVRFAADFEQHCDGVTPALFGAIRYNSTISDLTPFGGHYPVYSLQVTTTHGNVTGAGLSCGTSGGACQLTPNVATVEQLTAVPDPGYIFTGWTGDCHGPSTISITVYGPRTCGATFDPVLPTSPRTILFWNSTTGDGIGLGQSDIYSLQNSLWTATAESTQRGVTIGVTGITDAGEAEWTLQFRAPSGAVLQPGTYTGATRASFATTTPGIDVFGSGRGCNTTSGQFTVREIQFGPGETVAKLRIDFEQHCGTPTTPPLSGTIEFDSTLDTPLTIVSIDKTGLSFGATMNGSAGFASQSSAQAIRLTQSGPDTVTWSASSNSPWLIVSPTTGTGAATLNVSVDFESALPSAPATVSGLITIAASGASNSVAPIAVSLQLIAPSTIASAPTGSFDTPLDAATGLSGSIGVTGWALDDVQVARVTICRDLAAIESPTGTSLCGGQQQIYIGDAVFIDGARPDVQALYPASPFSTRAGWGYLLLTNFLPGGGNGTYRLYAYATDVDGHTTLLGNKTIGVDNAHATAPFGAIDTPGQGDIVSGVVANFGWVLSPGARRSDPPGGGTVTVYVDGAPVGNPGGWTSRSDLSALFPVSQYAGIDTALGVFGLDTTTLANGVHTISWAVTDTLGVTSGVGSRFFTVSNGAIQGSGLGDLRSGILNQGSERAKLAAASTEPATASVLLGRRGFDLSAPREYFFPGADGEVTIQAQELDRIELQLEPGATGVQITPQGNRPLPVGARIDPATGVFTWAPGAGFVGAYDFVLGHQRVRIVIRPKASGV